MKHLSRNLFLVALAAAASLSAQPQPLPPPTVNALLPNAVIAGSATFSMRVEGTRFTQSSRVVWRFGGIGATTLATTFLNETQLNAVVPASLVEQAGQVPVAVTQPGDAGISLVSNEVQFSIIPGVTIPTPCPLPNGFVNRAYDASFQPNGGVPPYTWSLPSGAVAPGLAFTPGGIVRGTPTTAGDFAFTVRVTDAQSSTAVKSCSIRILASQDGQSTFVTQLEPSGVLAGSVAVQLRVRGDGFNASDVVVWNAGTSAAVDLQTRWDGDPRFLNAIIPQNLLANPGAFPIAARRQVLTRQTFSNSEPFTVAAPLQVSSSCPLRDGSLRGSYNELLTATGGFPPYSWSLTQGSLPAGLTLRSNGELSGAPTEAGAYELTLGVGDSRGNTATRACSLRILGPLSTTPAAISFVADAQGAPPPAQVLSVSGSAPGLAFTVQAGVETGVGWLRVTTDSTRMPALVRVTAEPGSLGPGVYRGSVSISTDAATTRFLSVPVTLVINNVQAAAIVPRPLALRFAAGRGSAALPWQAIQVANPGPGSVDFTVEPTAAWLTAGAPRGVARNNQPALVRIRASAEGLAPGTYRGAVRLTAVGQVPVLVPVTLLVSIAPESLVLSQTGMTFTAVQGGPLPAGRSFHALSTGSAGGYFWEASTSVPLISARGFLSVNPPSNASRPGQASGSEIRVDTGNLSPEIYYGDVRVITASAENSPRAVSSVLQLLPAQAPLAPEFSFASLLLTAPAGAATSTAQGVTVRNLSRSPIVLDYQLAGEARIFSATATAARTLAPGELRRIEVRADVSTIGAGVHKAVLYVQSSNDSQVRAIDVTLVATPAGSARCTPTRLVVASLTHPDGFQLAGGLPSALEFRVLDDCGEPLNSGVFLVTPSTASGSTLLYPIGDGRWAGTWPVAQTTASTVSLQYSVEDPERGLQGSGAIAGSVTALAGIPVIAEDAVVSAASFVRGAPVSPGGIVSLFGVQLGEGQRAASSLPLSTVLGATRVTAGELDVPLFYADQGQVNGVLPYQLIPNTLHQMAVWRSNRRSAYVDVALAAAQPAVFAIVDGENPTALVTAASPIARGKVVVIYCEGLGPVTPPIVAGQMSPANPPSPTQNRVAVTIGGEPATVLFAGLTPGLAGLFQINAVVPETAAPGGAVPLVIASGGITGDAATIAVR